MAARAEPDSPFRARRAAAGVNRAGLAGLRHGCLACVALLSMAVLAACAQPGLSNQPQDYQDGYSAGCYNGRIAAGFNEPYSQPDPSRYGTNEQYTEGWKSGYVECFEQYKRFPPMGDRLQ
ncbi:MAG: hypothetical protein U1F33_15940 [Alphaproteobacteria bacterium]